MNVDVYRRPTAWLVAPVGLVILSLVGCGVRPVEVRGTVTVDGVPIMEGSISFEDVDGQGTPTGGDIKDGKYELIDKALTAPGEKLVRIVGLRKTGKKVEAPPPAPKGEMIDQVEQCVPAKYNDKSALKVTITPGKPNTHDFKLESKATAGTP